MQMQLASLIATGLIPVIATSNSSPLEGCPSGRGGRLSCCAKSQHPASPAAAPRHCERPLVIATPRASRGEAIQKTRSSEATRKASIDSRFRGSDVAFCHSCESRNPEPLCHAVQSRSIQQAPPQPPRHCDPTRKQGGSNPENQVKRSYPESINRLPLSRE